MDRTVNGQHRGPDFLCIGAPKSGTTWLFNHLGQHPDVWLPPVKELHYFDRVFPLPRAGTFEGERRGVLGLFAQYDRDLIWRAFARTLRPGSGASPAWAWRYLNGQISDDWYLSLFPSGARFSGEFTTDYCALDDEAVAHVYALLPAARVVFVMRDPIERSWSHAKMVLPRLLGKPLARLSVDEYEQFLTHPAPQRRGQYVNTLARWEAHYPKTQVHIEFYDHIIHDPVNVWQKVQQFLDLVPMAGDEQHLRQRVNPSRQASGGDMPGPVKALLARQHLGQLEQLAERFAGPPAQWLCSAHHALSDVAA